MSLRVGLFRLGQTLPRTPRHARLDTRQLLPSRSVSLIRDNQVPASKFPSYRDALKSSPQQLEVIHQYYPALAWEVSQTSSRALTDASQSEIDGTRVQDVIPRQDFETMLETLATSGRPNDLERIDEILSDMVNVFQVPPDVQTHSAIIRGLIHRKNLQTVQRWFQNMPNKPGNVAPTLEHYHVLLEACPEFAPFKSMRSCVQSMRQSDCLPNLETYRILIRGQWKLTVAKVPAPATLTPLLNEMRDDGIAYDSEFLEFLESQYMDSGLPKYAQDIKTIYQSVYESDLAPERLLENQWIPQLSNGQQSLKARLKAYAEFVQQGGSPSPSVFSALLQHSLKIADLEAIANVLDMDPTLHHWSILVANNIKADKMGKALVIYRKAVAAGIKPEASFVGPILTEIFESAEPPSNDLADSGLDLYHDFCTNTLTESSDLSPSNLEIHQMMIGALSKLSNNRDYSSATQNIIQELQARNVPLHSMTSSMIVTKMNLANDHKEAMQVYKAYKVGLDAQGYENVLEAFGRMCVQRILIPPLPMYFSIVKDMKVAGFPVTSSVYTILLRLLGQVGTLSHRKAEYYALVNRCVTATRRVHDLITLEAAIVPDALLWNQLMDTYFRLNCFGDVLRVWDQMYISRQFDNVSVSVVFDACRRTRAPHLVKQTYERLSRDNFRFSLNNWNSYIEALCSVGNINDALKALCWEMSNKGIKPDIDTANLILHQNILVKKPDLRTEVFARIEKFQPELYDKLEKAKLNSDNSEAQDSES